MAEDGSIIGKDSGKDILDIELGGMTIKSVRIVNDEVRNKWVQFGGFLLYPSNVKQIIRTPTWAIQENASLDTLVDGNDDTSGLLIQAREMMEITALRGSILV